MSFERIRLIFIGLGAILLVAAGLWIAATPGPIGTRLMGAFGVLFFSAGIWAAFRMAFKGQKLRKETGRALRTQQFILPVVLVLTLPWGLKLWFALPLLAAWLALMPEYRDRPALMAAAIFTAVIAIAQAVMFSLGAFGEIEQAHGASVVALHVVFLVMVLWLDGLLLWHARSRLR